MDTFSLIKQNSKKLMLLKEEDRCLALTKIHDELLKKIPLIIEANKLDIENAKKENYPSAFIERMSLSSEKIKSIALSVLEVRDYKKVVGIIEEERTREDELTIIKERIPLGVILMIFESRPNVVIDTAALAIKSGNAIILKGGKECYHTNTILGEIIRESTSSILPKGTISVLDSRDREIIKTLLKRRDAIDLVIPRGGEKLISFIYENSKIPVLAHYKGMCHIYLDHHYQKDFLIPILLNAKTQRPGVCNAVETFLYHKDALKEDLENLFTELIKKGVTLYADQETISTFKNISFKHAEASNYETEYLALFLNIKRVDNIQEAITHIGTYGSNHTEAIISDIEENITLFKNSIDASMIAINSSTRFNDGGELGLGAELGISTTKLHAYGAMGAKEMTTTRYVIRSKGKIRK